MAKEATSKVRAVETVEAVPQVEDWSYAMHGHKIDDMRGLPSATLRYALQYGLNKIVQDHVSGDKAELVEAYKAGYAGTASGKQNTIVVDAAGEIGRDSGDFATAEAFADAVVDHRRHAKLAALIRGEVSAPRTGGVGRATSWEALRKEAAAIVLEAVHVERGKVAPPRGSKAFKEMVEKLLRPDAKNASRVEAKAKELSASRTGATTEALDL